MSDKPDISAVADPSVKAKLKSVETVEKNVLPTKEDIEAEKKS
eukprot:CAMPEP_0170560512 /NCGR_PEP_ID=MMETSP0211-20121228/49283_1 /TAXON_ID=311385 /ORGANISM="Pseudokeronopsis sp., Strain OXSARD2" /LENGTH=42 /DNA_ID= /DNA_START= /DNA_END= /DNA_ORIENTATION=